MVENLSAPILPVGLGWLFGAALALGAGWALGQRLAQVAAAALAQRLVARPWWRSEPSLPGGRGGPSAAFEAAAAPSATADGAVATRVVFYLALEATPTQRQAMEEVLREAAWASPHWAFRHPLRIVPRPSPTGLRLVLYAFATTQEHQLDFVADVTRIALDIAAHEGIPLTAAKPPPPALVERPEGTPLM
ncbi:MAG: hypothetical protein ACFCBW_04835 [Candidatus Competibacterales bacterium]